MIGRSLDGISGRADDLSTRLMRQRTGVVGKVDAPCAGVTGEARSAGTVDDGDPVLVLREQGHGGRDRRIDQVGDHVDVVDIELLRTPVPRRRRPCSGDPPLAPRTIFRGSCHRNPRRPSSPRSRLPHRIRTRTVRTYPSTHRSSRHRPRSQPVWAPALPLTSMVAVTISTPTDLQLHGTPQVIFSRRMQPIFDFYN
jgi:hypothetical protein